MRKFVNLTGLFFVITLTSFNIHSRSDYDIANIYTGYELTNGSKALTDDGLTDVRLILSISKLDPGKYVVKITRKAPNVYQVDGKNIYIETRYCYEYSSGQEVVLSIESSYGYSKGKIIF